MINCWGCKKEIELKEWIGYICDDCFVDGGICGKCKENGKEKGTSYPVKLCSECYAEPYFQKLDREEGRGKLKNGEENLRWERRVLGEWERRIGLSESATLSLEFVFMPLTAFLFMFGLVSSFKGKEAFTPLEGILVILMLVLVIYYLYHRDFFYGVRYWGNRGGFRETEHDLDVEDIIEGGFPFSRTSSDADKSNKETEESNDTDREGKSDDPRVNFARKFSKDEELMKKLRRKQQDEEVFEGGGESESSSSNSSDSENKK